MIKTGIFRLEQDGPSGEGLTRLQLSQDDFQSELPEQNWHIAFEDETLGLAVGVWTTTEMQETFGPYPGDEFMHLLEGSVILLDEEGRETHIGQGETFFVRNGIPVSWKQNGFCRKFFMTHLAPDAPVPEIDKVDCGIHILREAELEKTLKKSDDNERDAVCFTNDTGNMVAGMWEVEPFEGRVSPFPVHELARILEGEVVITEADGPSHTFVAGDVFFIAAGTNCSWRAVTRVRKFYCTLDPA